jgi:DDE superfamily endonuclease
VLLGLLVEAFVPEGPLLVGIDETLERRWGKKKIAAKGVYRDPVRSTHENFVKSSGLRWVCVMLLVEIPWAARVWALPFLSALAPSERYAAERGKRHKKITDWAWQLLLRIRRWYPEREIVAVADSAFTPLSSCCFVAPKLEQAGDLHHPAAPGCCALRAGSSAPPRSDREASP